MRTALYHKRSVFSYFAKPLCACLVMAGFFGLVKLRSSVVSVEYTIGALEQKKDEAIRERKLLVAELASLRSIQVVDAREMALAFPDRQKVVYVKRDGGGAPSYPVSLRKD